MTVMGMMTLANEGISLRLHLVCWVGPFDFSISAFQLFSPFPRVRRATFFSVSTSPWVSWSMRHFHSSNLTQDSNHLWYLASRFTIQRRHQGIANSLSTTHLPRLYKRRYFAGQVMLFSRVFLISCMLPGRYVINAWMCSCTLGTR